MTENEVGRMENGNRGKKEILILLQRAKLKLKLGHYQRGKLRKRQPENCGFLLANSDTGDAGKKMSMLNIFKNNFL